MVTRGNMENLHRSLKENSICARVFLSPLMREVISSSKPQPNNSHTKARKKKHFHCLFIPSRTDTRGHHESIREHGVSTKSRLRA